MNTQSYDYRKQEGISTYIKLSKKQAEEINNIYKIQAHRQGYRGRCNHMVIRMLIQMGIEAYKADDRYKYYITELKRVGGDIDKLPDRLTLKKEINKKRKEEKENQEVESEEWEEKETEEEESNKQVTYTIDDIINKLSY